MAPDELGVDHHVGGHAARLPAAVEVVPGDLTVPESLDYPRRTQNPLVRYVGRVIDPETKLATAVGPAAGKME
jgi:hypothetical protein